MSTILFEDVVFGPIKSRRLGTSLGINLSPKHGKWCSFDCIYCECGFNKDGKQDTRIPTVEEFRTALEIKLKEIAADNTHIDSITFSGNGEPTLHPHFKEVIEHTVALRDHFCKNAVITVFTNGSQLDKESVRDALKMVNNPTIKIDSPLEWFVNMVDRPNEQYSLAKTIDNIKLFNGNFVLQTMFLKGTMGGKHFDSCCKENVEAWIKLVRELKPRSIMMYTIDRETPAKGLEKVTAEQMESIAKPLIDEGFEIQIRG